MNSLEASRQYADNVARGFDYVATKQLGTKKGDITLDVSTGQMQMYDGSGNWTLLEPIAQGAILPTHSIVKQCSCCGAPGQIYRCFYCRVLI